VDNALTVLLPRGDVAFKSFSKGLIAVVAIASWAGLTHLILRLAEEVPMVCIENLIRID
jgi:hypothetical protein